MLCPDSSTVVSDDGAVVSVVSSVAVSVVVGSSVVVVGSSVVVVVSSIIGLYEVAVINCVAGLRYPPLAPVVSDAVAASSSA